MKILASIGLRLWYMKTWILSFVLGLHLLLNADNGLLKQWSIRQDIKRQEAELEQYKHQFNADSRALENLRNDPSVAERIARERYLMKRENEDIYLFPNPNDSI